MKSGLPSTMTTAETMMKLDMQKEENKHTSQKATPKSLENSSKAKERTAK